MAPSEKTLKSVEDRLRNQAKKKKMSKDRADAYVYGTKRKMGWKPEKEK
tara:strand:+ start:59 stop:205 length:147 start_codon:yes stop_codon:yes gene_type:complete